MIAASAMGDNPIATDATDNLTQAQEFTVQFDGNKTVKDHDYIKFDVSSVGNAVKINRVSIDFDKWNDKWNLYRLCFKPVAIDTLSLDTVPKAGKPDEFDIVVTENKKDDSVASIRIYEEVDKLVKPALINLIIPGEIQDNSGNKKQIYVGRKAFKELRRSYLSVLPSRPLRINLQFTEVNARKVQLADDCSEMFYCSELIDTIDLSGVESSSVTDMSFMFFKCSNLNKIIFKDFNTSNVTTMEGMFEYCESLNHLDISKFNTNNVTDMSWMFSRCKSLSELTCIGSFNTQNVTDMSCMFNGCVSLTHLPKLDMQNVKDDREMFDDCISCIYKQKKAENVINAPVPWSVIFDTGYSIKYLKHLVRSWTSSLF